MHVYIEMSQGNSLFSYGKQTKTLLFSLTKSENSSTGQVLPGVEDWCQCGGEVGKGCGWVNIVQILCTHECKWKNETC
jgi:hypothetical protein